MTVAVSGDSITFPDNSVQATAPKVGMVNRVINGGMTIDQRNAGASVTPANAAYVLDRYINNLTQASKFSVQQSSTAPAGFTNSMLVTSLSAYSITSTDNFQFEQRIEGLNCGDLAWGTASAAAVTISFQVRSSLTGTFGGSLRNNAGDRSYPFTYTISAANTWEQKTINIVGDTSGTWLTTNGVGVRVGFSLGTGSTLSGTAGSWAGANYLGATGATSVVGTSGATFYITGVQLEKGSTATSFDYRPYGTELGLCQRYFLKTPNDGFSTTAALLNSITGGSDRVQLPFFPAPFRATPTLTTHTPTGTSGQLTEFSSTTIRTISAVGNVGVNGGGYAQSTTGLANSVYANLTYSAEL